MGKHHRNRRSPNPSQAPALESSSGWDFRAGYSGSARLFDGSKFRGSLIFPAATDLDYSALRMRSRLAAWDSTEGGAIIETLVDNVVGSGLALQAQPIWDIINHPRLTTDEAREKYVREIELRFWLWANSPQVSADASRNLAELQRFAFLNCLRDGETCHILRYNPRRDRISPLSVQNIDVEQIETPLGKTAENDAKIRGNRISDGVEVDSNGEMVAVHIKDPETRLYTRITTWGGNGTGRRWVLHPIISDLVGAVRGTPLLAPILHELEKITTYKVAELEATINNAIILAYISTAIDGDKRNPLDALGGIRGRTPSQAAPASASTPEGPARVDVSGAGIFLQSMGKGQEIKTVDTKHPNSNFEGFVRAVARILSARLNVPLEVLEKSFNANYSASRASLILFWKTVTHWRDFLVAQFLRPIYEAWFSEEIRAGRLSEVGDAWNDPVLRAAWLNASWDGESLPSIDPVKDAEEADRRIAQGALTHEANARKYNGSDFNANVQRLKKENALLKDAGVAPTTSAAKPIPAQDENGDEAPAPEDTPAQGGSK